MGNRNGKKKKRSKSITGIEGVYDLKNNPLLPDEDRNPAGSIRRPRTTDGNPLNDTRFTVESSFPTEDELLQLHKEGAIVEGERRDEPDHTPVRSCRKKMYAPEGMIDNSIILTIAEEKKDTLFSRVTDFFKQERNPDKDETPYDWETLYEPWICAPSVPKVKPTPTVDEYPDEEVYDSHPNNTRKDFNSLISDQAREASRLSASTMELIDRKDDEDEVLSFNSAEEEPVSVESIGEGSVSPADPTALETGGDRKASQVVGYSGDSDDVEEDENNSQASDHWTEDTRSKSTQFTKSWHSHDNEDGEDEDEEDGEDDDYVDDHDGTSTIASISSIEDQNGDDRDGPPGPFNCCCYRNAVDSMDTDDILQLKREKALKSLKTRMKRSKRAAREANRLYEYVRKLKAAKQRLKKKHRS